MKNEDKIELLINAPHLSFPTNEEIEEILANAHFFHQREEEQHFFDEQPDTLVLCSF